MDIKITLCVLAFLGLTGRVAGQSYAKSDFHEIPHFKYMSAEWLRIDTARNYKAFSVSLKNGNLQIEDQHFAAVKGYPIPGGQLLAADYGEFGGGLYYKTLETLKKAIWVNGFMQLSNNNEEKFNRLRVSKWDTSSNLMKGNLVKLDIGHTSTVLPFGNAWLFIEGLAHMGINYGSLNKIVFKDDSFYITKNFIFKTAPTAIAVYKDKIFVATYSGFYCLNNHFEQEFVLDDLFWKGLYVTSLAIIDEKHIYAGLHGGYGLINIPEKTVKFFEYRPQKRN